MGFAEEPRIANFSCKHKRRSMPYGCQHGCQLSQLKSKVTAASFDSGARFINGKYKLLKTEDGLEAIVPHETNKMPATNVGIRSC